MLARSPSWFIAVRNHSNTRAVTPHTVRELVFHPELSRVRYLVVLDENTARGVLDLDRARGAVRYNDPKQNLLVEDIYEPVSAANCLRGDSPLIDYLLTADEKPFRLVEMPGHKLGIIDVQDLQKLPVRALLFMYFCHLETLLARRLCEKNPDLQEIVGTKGGVDAQDLGNTGTGPERKIERYRLGDLLRRSAEEESVTIDQDGISFLERFRNNLAHGPRWYITRRGDIRSLVKCIKKVTDMIDEMESDSSKGHPHISDCAKTPERASERRGQDKVCASRPQRYVGSSGDVEHVRRTVASDRAAGRRRDRAGGRRLPKADIHLHSEAGPRLEQVIAERSGAPVTDWRAHARELMRSLPPGMPRLETWDPDLPLPRATVDELDRPRTTSRRGSDASWSRPPWTVPSWSRFCSEDRQSYARISLISSARLEEARSRFPRLHAVPLVAAKTTEEWAATLLPRCIAGAGAALAGLNILPAPFDRPADWSVVHAGRSVLAMPDWASPRTRESSARCTWPRRWKSPA